MIALRHRSGQVSLLTIEIGQDARSTLHTVANFYLDLRRSIQQDVSSGTELDESDSLSSLYCIADFFRKDDTPCEKAGNLLENDRVSFSFDSHRVLLVAIGACGIHSIQELPRLILRSADRT